MLYAAADIPLNYDDPMCVGSQVGGQVDLAWWCPVCEAHTAWTWLWLMPWVRIQLPICWWCNGPQKADKPTRTVQRVDGTIRDTRLEEEARADLGAMPAFLA